MNYPDFYKIFHWVYRVTVCRFLLQDTKSLSDKEKRKLVFECLVLISVRSQAWKLSCFTKQIVNEKARKDLETSVHKLRSEIGNTLQVLALGTFLLRVLTLHLKYYAILFLCLKRIVTSEILLHTIKCTDSFTENQKTKSTCRRYINVGLSAFPKYTSFYWGLEWRSG